MKERREVTVKYVGGHPYVSVSFGHKQMTFKRNCPRSKVPYDMFEEMTNDAPGDFEICEDPKPENIQKVKHEDQEETEEIKKRGRPRKA